MHAVRNALLASGLFPKQGLSRLSQRSSRRGVLGPGATAGAPGHASGQLEGDMHRAQLHRPRQRRGRDLGMAVFVRCSTGLLVRAVDVCRVHEGTVGIAKGWGWPRGSGGHIAECPKARWSSACARSEGRVQTECVGALEGVSDLSVEHRWLGCECCGVGMALARGGASGNALVTRTGLC
jgi:hypothetical protein